MTRESVALGQAPELKERRMRLQQAVAKKARALETGAHEIDVAELQALAGICDDAHLPIEAARIRRWIADA
jgi:hypothetical protein